MTMDSINEILDAIIRGSLLGLLAGFWLMGLAAIWKWFLGVAKRFLHWLSQKQNGSSQKNRPQKETKIKAAVLPGAAALFVKE